MSRQSALLAATLLFAGCGRWGYEVAADDVRTDDGGLPATEIDGGAGAGPGCGSLELLSESFDGGATRLYWYPLYSGGAAVRLASDRVELAPGAGAGDAAATYTSDSSFDLRGSALGLEVVRAGGRSSGVELRDGAGRDRFGALIGASHGVAFAVEDGALEALALDGEAATVLASGPYDPAAARFWRLREADGAIAWETSPDRATWSAFHRERVALDARLVYPALFARGQTAAGSEAAFDAVNLPAAAVPGFCAATSLRDDFAGAALAPAWRAWNGAGTCTVSAGAGAATLAFPGSFSACSLVSLARFDLRRSAFAVELAAVPRASSFQTLVELRSGVPDDHVELRLSGTTARLAIYQAGVIAAQSSTTFDPAATPFVRLRGDGPMLDWDTSADGVTWTTPLSMASLVDLSAVSLAITGIQNGTAPTTLRIGSVNRP